MTLYGRVHLRSATWWCPRCRTLQTPLWEPLALPPGTYTWAVGERAAHLGVLLPSFDRGAESFAYLTGIALSARELELCTEGVGAAYTLPERSISAPPPRPDVVYVETDAVKVHFRDVPNPAEPFQEVKVFCTWSQTGAHVSAPRYWAGDTPWDTHLAALETLTEWEGLRTARVVVCLGDGAPPLWTLLTALDGTAVQILDWYHAQEHLLAVAKLLPDAPDWYEAQRTHLWEGRWRAVIRALIGVARDGATADVQKAARTCAGYFWRHRRRLDYPTARARGYPIGSGRIESACKLVVSQRCKGPGMRWRHAHAVQVLQARCAWLNADWRRACRRWRATGHFAPPTEVLAAA